MLNNSIIIAAHPDDENLWFSSILSKVDKIVLCFLSVPSRPAWTEGRKRSLAAYPLDNVHCLELIESEVFEGADWERPIVTDYGLKITQSQLSDKRYRQNYDILKARLRDHIRGKENVFTHNPWGEYGHVEHVQVYRAVKALQKEMQFNLWFANYASNKSAHLMTKLLPQYDTQVMLNTDSALAKRVAELYKANGCWTWYDDYEWCDKEIFISDPEVSSGEVRYGTLLPINMINICMPPKPLSSLEKYFFKLRDKLRILPPASNGSR